MSRMTELFSEIVDRIVADDWSKVFSDDRNRWFYVLGLKAYDEAITNSWLLSTMEGAGKPQEKWGGPGPLAEAFIRSQLAKDRPDYLAGAKQKLLGAGIPEQAISKWLAVFFDPNATADSQLGEFWKMMSHAENVPLEQWCALISDSCEALRLSKSSELSKPVDAEDQETIDRMREKLCLREMARDYPKLVRRWEQFETTDYIDAQVEEASRCYIDRFYRAAIVLSACALEKHLKIATGIGRFSNYSQLVSFAEQQRKLDGAQAQAANRVFNVRNKVVHESWSPSFDDAKEVVGLARRIVAELHKRAS